MADVEVHRPLQLGRDGYCNVGGSRSHSWASEDAQNLKDLGKGQRTVQDALLGDWRTQSKVRAPRSWAKVGDWRPNCLDAPCKNLQGCCISRPGGGSGHGSYAFDAYRSLPRSIETQPMKCEYVPEPYADDRNHSYSLYFPGGGC